nr:MAG TPA: terminase small subunit [Caudoviricetes sp.]
MSKLAKPANVESDAFRSAKWDELTSGRDFSQSDAPTLALLVSWYQVIEQCMDDIGANGGVQVAYQNDMGDIKALPQLSTMKQASAEIRALSRQLGLDEPHSICNRKDIGRAKVLSLVISDRQKKAAQANG